MSMDWKIQYYEVDNSPQIDLQSSNLNQSLLRISFLFFPSVCLSCRNCQVYPKSYMEMQGTSKDQNNHGKAKAEVYTLPYYKAKVIKTKV